jgi:hypothetical protein
MSKSELDRMIYIKLIEIIKYLKTEGCFDDDGKLLLNEYSIVKIGFSLS